MKIPKYIDTALKKRTDLAYRLDSVCHIVDRWLDEHNIECDTCDTHTGCEIYMNPEESEARIRAEIEKA